MESEKLKVEMDVTGRDLEILQEITGYSKSLIHMVINGHRVNEKVLVASETYLQMKAVHTARFEEEVKEHIAIAKQMFHRQNPDVKNA